MLEGRQFPDPRHYADPHATTEERSQEEGRSGGRCRGIAGQQTGELLVLMVLLRVARGRRQVLMVQLMMVGVRGDGAAAKDILDKERRPAS